MPLKKDEFGGGDRNSKAGALEAGMSILEKLAIAAGRNDEQLNIRLAEDIVKRKDKKAVAELAEGLSQGSQAVKSDCIKALYEIGERNPSLIAPYVALFGELVTLQKQQAGMVEP
jgi:HEAT repeat protein